ncbi:MAG: UvrD-helicase domain-containing protein [Candidatus Glassbacteria bacterium]|nr:UvrD-helicase domain-containing protein [Candidatus Glassbacteria bacterium]
MTDSIKEKLIEALNPPQREAVTHKSGPLLVLAGAGSGKTRVLTYRIAYLARVHQVNPGRMLALTFTNKAAGEMKSRLQGLLGEDISRLWIGTFHSMFARILRREAEAIGYTAHYSIYDTDDSQRLIKKIIKELPAEFGSLNPASVQQAVSRYKNDLRTPEEVRDQAAHFVERKAARVYAEYCRQLKENNAMDFDDLILKPMELFRAEPEVLERYRRRFSYILIDEYQDTNRAQYNLVRSLVGEERNICVVGDDDQSIYGWRGADIRNILEFERDFEGVTTIRLEQNYRSTGNILEVANAVVRRNTGRKPKKLWTEKSSGARAVVLECVHELDEAEQIVIHASAVRTRERVCWREMAVLYRTNAQSRALEDAFRRAGIPYRIIGGLRFYERREIKDLMAYLKVIVNPRDSTSLYRIINVPARGIGPATLTRLSSLASSRGEPLYHVLAEADQAEGLTDSTAGKVIELHTWMEELRALSRSESASKVLTELIRLSRYEESLSDLETFEAQGRMENIAELVSAAQEYSERYSPENGATCLEAWLAETSLVSEIDFHDPEEDCATLMTLHNAKGLEFPVVFIAGVEENLLPIARAFEDTTGAKLEEERRLFYVGITRAMDKLFLCWAASRRRFADILESSPSSFLRDIPEELVERHSGLTHRPAAARRSGFSFSRGGGRRAPIGAAPPILGPGRPGSGGARPTVVGITGPIFEKDYGADEPAYRMGERVVHHTFGSGTILEVSPYSDDFKLLVRFDSGFTKKLMARFARLKRE